jgi:hypothetical protein
MKLADIKEKDLMDDYYRYRKEAITRDTRLTPRTLLR